MHASIGWREKDAITNATSEDIACLLITTLMPVAEWNLDNEKSSQVKTGVKRAALAVDSEKDTVELQLREICIGIKLISIHVLPRAIKNLQAYFMNPEAL